MFKSIKEYLKSILSEDYGNFSFTRFMSLTTLLTVLGTWITKNIQADGFVDFGENSVYIIGLVITGKVVQKLVEVAGQVKETELNKKSEE